MATPGFTDSIFQSTLSVRRATRVYTGDTKILLISIHALRKESDAHTRRRPSIPCYFNPRSP